MARKNPWKNTRFLTDKQIDEIKESNVLERIQHIRTSKCANFRCLILFYKDGTRENIRTFHRRFFRRLEEFKNTYEGVIT